MFLGTVVIVIWYLCRTEVRHFFLTITSSIRAIDTGKTGHGEGVRDS